MERQTLRRDLSPEKKKEVEAVWLRFASSASQSIGAVIDPEGEEGPDPISAAMDVGDYANRMVKEWDARFNETSVFIDSPAEKPSGASVTEMSRHRRRRRERDDR